MPKTNRELTEKEIWKTISQYPYYEASSLGRIRSKDRWVKNNTTLRKGRILKGIITHKGYHQVKISPGISRGFVTGAHRLVAMAFLPNPNNFPQINHIDGNKLNNAPQNLEWCDNDYNVAHKVRMGLSAKLPAGRNPNAKFTQEDVDEIRNLYSMGITMKEIANKFNKHETHIQEILKGRVWKDGKEDMFKNIDGRKLYRPNRTAKRLQSLREKGSKLAPKEVIKYDSMGVELERYLGISNAAKNNNICKSSLQYHLTQSTRVGQEFKGFIWKLV